MRILRTTLTVAVMGLALSSDLTAQAQVSCDLITDRPSYDQVHQTTERVRNCSRMGQKLRIDGFSSDVDWRSVAFNPDLPLVFEFWESWQRIELDILSSRIFSRLYTEHICRDLAVPLSKLQSKCPIPSFFDISISDVFNMYIMSSPKGMNFNYVAAPLKFKGGDLGDVSANALSPDSYMVLRRLELDDVQASRINFEKLIILEDLVVKDSTVETVLWEDIVVLGDLVLETSRIDYLSLENILGAGQFRSRGLSGNSLRIRTAAFQNVRLHEFGFELEDWEAEEIERFARTGAYRY